MTSESHGTPSDERAEVSEARLREHMAVDGWSAVRSLTADEVKSAVSELLTIRALLTPRSGARSNAPWPGDALDQLVSTLEAIEYLAHNDIKAPGMKSAWDFARYGQGLAVSVRELLALRALSLTGSGGSPNLGWAYDGSVLSPEPTLKETGSVVAWINGEREIMLGWLRRYIDEQYSCGQVDDGMRLERLHKLLSSASEPITAREWEPIETAPKGTEFILVRLSNGEVFRAFRTEHGYHASSDIGFVNAKHWMPLPPLNTSGEKL